MRSATMTLLLGLGLLIAPSAPAAANEPKLKLAAPAAVKAEIETLKPDKVAWREITWQSCLLSGLKEARARNKPVLLWVFIDRPADDARC